ncbi:hypothetical protein HDU76_008953 [Blyttiomyces sp. JEL0837]|nr:hypothetical protein HDU76_008953 [Blyttiomyces sp. JEL0837]
MSIRSPQSSDLELDAIKQAMRRNWEQRSRGGSTANPAADSSFPAGSLSQQQNPQFPSPPQSEFFSSDGNNNNPTTNDDFYMNLPSPSTIPGLGAMMLEHLASSAAATAGGEDLLLSAEYREYMEELKEKGINMDIGVDKNDVVDIVEVEDDGYDFERRETATREREREFKDGSVTPVREMITPRTSSARDQQRDRDEIRDRQQQQINAISDSPDRFFPRSPMPPMPAMPVIAGSQTLRRPSNDNPAGQGMGQGGSRRPSATTAESPSQQRKGSASGVSGYAAGGSDTVRRDYTSGRDRSDDGGRKEYSSGGRERSASSAQEYRGGNSRYDDVRRDRGAGGAGSSATISRSNPSSSTTTTTAATIDRNAKVPKPVVIPTRSESHKYSQEDVQQLIQQLPKSTTKKIAAASAAIPSSGTLERGDRDRERERDRDRERDRERDRKVPGPSGTGTAPRLPPRGSSAATGGVAPGTSTLTVIPPRSGQSLAMGATLKRGQIPARTASNTNTYERSGSGPKDGLYSDEEREDERGYRGGEKSRERRAQEYGNVDRERERERPRDRYREDDKRDRYADRERPERNERETPVDQPQSQPSATTPPRAFPERRKPQGIVLYNEEVAELPTATSGSILPTNIIPTNIIPTGIFAALTNPISSAVNAVAEASKKLYTPSPSSDSANPALSPPEGANTETGPASGRPRALTTPSQPSQKPLPDVPRKASEDAGRPSLDLDDENGTAASTTTGTAKALKNKQSHGTLSRRAPPPKSLTIIPKPHKEPRDSFVVPDLKKPAIIKSFMDQQVTRDDDEGSVVDLTADDVVVGNGGLEVPGSKLLKASVRAANQRNSFLRRSSSNPELDKMLEKVARGRDDGGGDGRVGEGSSRGGRDERRPSCEERRGYGDSERGRRGDDRYGRNEWQASQRRYGESEGTTLDRSRGRRTDNMDDRKTLERQTQGREAPPRNNVPPADRRDPVRDLKTIPPRRDFDSGSRAAETAAALRKRDLDDFATRKPSTREPAMAMATLRRPLKSAMKPSKAPTVEEMMAADVADAVVKERERQAMGYSTLRRGASSSNLNGGGGSRVRSQSMDRNVNGGVHDGFSDFTADHVVVKGVIDRDHVVSFRAIKMWSLEDLRRRLQDKLTTMGSTWGFLETEDSVCIVDTIKRRDEDGNWITVGDDEDWILCVEECVDGTVQLFLDVVWA